MASARRWVTGVPVVHLSAPYSAASAASSARFSTAPTSGSRRPLSSQLPSSSSHSVNDLAS